jgi:acetyl-CoA carboxylase carboxyltransferase component
VAARQAALALRSHIVTSNITTPQGAAYFACDVTVKAGSWWPEAVTKGLRAQKIAMRNPIPIPGASPNAVH